MIQCTLSPAPLHITEDERNLQRRNKETGIVRSCHAASNGRILDSPEQWSPCRQAGKKRRGSSIFELGTRLFCFQQASEVRCYRPFFGRSSSRFYSPASNSTSFSSAAPVRTEKICFFFRPDECGFSSGGPSPHTRSLFRRNGAQSLRMYVPADTLPHMQGEDAEGGASEQRWGSLVRRGRKTWR